MPASLKLDGLKEMNKKLAALGQKVVNKVSRDALREGAKVMRKEMRAAAPKGDSGRLRKSIKYKIKGKKGNFRARVGIIKGKDKKQHAYYAYFVEYGTKEHRIPAETVGARKNKTKNKTKIVINGQVYSKAIHPGTKPNPFLRRSWERTKKQSFEAIKKTLWKRTHQEANRI